MGYTHYFTANPSHKPTDHQWNKIKSRIRNEVFERHSEILCAESDNPLSPPSTEGESIIFNGKGDEGHETFCLSRSASGFDFCKTAHKPYDGAVVEALKIVREVCPDWLELSSDGDVF